MQPMHRGRMLWKFYELVMEMLSGLHNFLQTQKIKFHNFLQTQIFRLKFFPSKI